MRQINFSDVGVAVNSMEELDEIYLTYTALDISFGYMFKEHSLDAQRHNLVGYFVQSIRGDLKASIDTPDIEVSIIKYPIGYSIAKLDFAVAYHLLKSNQTDALIEHLDKYCQEYK